jgi:diguanylate cyclase (GGDEF) domain protein
MSTKINKVIRDTIQTMKERNLVLTPDNYSEIFCEIAKKNGIALPDCQKMDNYISRLNVDIKEQLKAKNPRNLDEFFAFLVAKLNANSGTNDPLKLTNALALMSKRVLQVTASLHNREARKLADASIEILNRKLDILAVEKVKDKWFDFLSQYDDTFFNRLCSYGAKSLDDIETAIIELDNAMMTADNASAQLSKLTPLLVSMLSPSISDKMSDEIEILAVSLKDNPSSLQNEKVQENIKELTKKRIELDREEIASKVLALDEVLDNINDRIISLMHSSNSSSEKMQYIRNDLDSINLKQDSFESIRDKLIKITNALDDETREFSSKMSEDQKTIKELQDKVNKLENELEAVKKESKEDFLTKTATKRALIEELERIEEKYKRYGSDYSVCFFDIDHFKKINDTYGHEAGDVILASVGQLLRKYSRQVDFVGRYGGEEFVVLLPEIPLANGINLANKLREILQNAKFMYKDERINVTASCGVSVRSANSSWMLTIEEADKMLYLAKQSGRNRVMPEIVNAKNK